MPGRVLCVTVAILASSLVACTQRGTEQAAAPAPAAASPAAAPAPPPAAAATADETAARLSAYRWRLQAATDAQGQALADLLPEPDRALALLFADGRIGVEGGCNRGGASYQLLDAAQIQVGQWMSTMMACPPPLDRVDAAIAATLAGTLTATIEGGPDAPTLQLVTAAGSTLSLRGEPTPETRFGGPGTIAFLEVAAQRGPCEPPPAPARDCLLVRDREFDANGLAVGTPGDWRPLPQGIEGYAAADGEQQVVRVKRFEQVPPGGGEPVVHYVLDLVVETRVAKP